MAVQILFRRGLAADWTSVNPILASGEPGHETDTGKFKIGNGTSTWTALSYADTTVTNLADLADVTSTTPTSGQVLKWNGSAWAPAAESGGGGVTNLADLADVTSTTPTSGQVLKYNGSAWAPAADVDTNTNTTYTVSAETATGGVDIRLTGSDTTADAVKIAAGANVTVTRTDASTITIASTGGGGGASALTGLSDVSIATPTSGQVLKYNGAAWVNDTDATGGGGAGTLATRASLAGTTASLANNASGNLDVTGYSAYALLKIQTSAAAWVRVYVSDATRTADTARLQGVDPTPGSGVIAEVITTGAETIIISPVTLGFNNEAPPTTNIPVRVTNLSGSSAAITVTLTAIQLEA